MSIMDFFRRKKTSLPPKITENIHYTVVTGRGAIQFIDLGLPSGTLWADRNSGAEGVYKLGTLYDKTNAPGKLPTYEQCIELIKECNFSSCLVQDDKEIMKNYIKVEGPNKNHIFFPCVRSCWDDSEIGAYCWCDEDMGNYSYSMMLQLRLFGILDFAEIKNLTIDVAISSSKLMVRNVKKVSPIHTK